MIDEISEARLLLASKMYNWNNFFIETVADWTLCEMPDRLPDYVSYSGSTYWDFGDRVRRWSDHWGPRVASCCWYLDHRTLSLPFCLCGEYYYEDFRHIRSRIHPDE